MSGGANDKHALIQSDRDLLDRRVAFLAEAPGHNNLDQQLLLLAYRHIGVLDNQIANIGQQYRLIERQAETLAVRAWDEGFGAGFVATETSPVVNPYRKPEATE